MKINYVLMYGTPFLKLKYFEKFDDISKYLVNHRIVDYTIYEKMDDSKEVEMICLQSDVRVLEKRIDKAIEYIKEVEKIDNYLDGVPCIRLLEILEKGEDKE